ncbi:MULTISPECIES: arginine--tRNA ligase [Marivita]|uniref:Arginine--tRNA ligase n=1 Tax=Marivita cryptomonadis TaxID=505252 RepID=A0A9Q2S424_9RHOB|nr:MULTISPECIES: arginine--tRNA ligase [Marivita]MCR9170196.1 arginine--tRNA ligase [Paracoccaceae bacterium]MBM2320719.1 arginine--tRNA ligase [Marivita cryptomonadis]MBM2330299.1 arginine--tRNA ligase [Marivita cryptomonadis]MBM2339886.1 arginine--tRNA ligase [Marivita cryptomonadis]MBM2344545.1 arginine--tRNA ligase [Marivita cryptomonadis]
MNLFSDIRALVIDSLNAMVAEGALPGGLDFANVTVEPPRDPLHGDMATNAAMVLAKPAGAKPRDIAEALAAKLSDDPRVSSAEVAGPGFLNLRLGNAVWQGLPKAILTSGMAYGKSAMGQGKKVNVEYVSANPTGPLHVGHTRGAVFGDALASLLDYAGYEVTREYYINDGGAQVDVLARSVYLRYLEAHGQDVAFVDGTYPGDYLIPVGEALKDKVGDAYVGQPEDVWLEEVRNFATDAMMMLIRADLGSLGVEMDKFFSEKSLYGTGLIESAIKDLDDKGLIYRGTLEPPKGKTPEDWEPREQTLFRSTAHGDDVDRPIQKSDGAWTYFAPDIAYHYDKVQRGYDLLIDVFGADHGGYVKRMKAAVSALSGGKTPLDIKLTQLVKLYKNGEPFKMSKRAGTFVTLSDVVAEVGPDVTRFVMLTRKNDAPLDFDFDKVLEQSKDNPVFYVQYAVARVNSVLRKATEAGVQVDDATLAGIDLSDMAHDSELAVARKLAEWPRLIEIAARTNEPHRVAFYLYELASDLHALYNKGNDVPELRFLQEGNTEASQAKIALARSVSVVISAGLGILGVTPVEEMR